MSVLVAFRAESVGPVVKRLVKENENLVAVHEDDIDFSKLVSPKVVQQPTPPDPLRTIWAEAAEQAQDFANLNPVRSDVVKAGIDRLVQALTRTRQAVDTPAPVAPPAPKVEPKVLVRWGARRAGIADIVINTAEAVGLARDKKESRRLLSGLCPTTWFRQSEIRTPCVIRPRRHHAGKKFFVCNTAQEVDRAIIRCGPGWYATTLVDKAAEYRVFILQDRVIRVSEKHQGDDGTIAWNVGQGASAAGLARKNWPMNVVKQALSASRRLGLDWTAIDICVDKAGNAWVLEANTAPGIQSGSRALEQISWAFAWIAKNDIPARLNLDAVTDWKSVLHPSLLESLEG